MASLLVPETKFICIVDWINGRSIHLTRVDTKEETCVIVEDEEFLEGVREDLLISPVFEVRIDDGEYLHLTPIQDWSSFN